MDAKDLHWLIGDRVQKVGGDYQFDGEVRAIVRKRSGQTRYVVEDDHGLLFIFHGDNLRFANKPT